MSYTASSASHSNLPMGFNYLSNQAAIQQVWVRFERPVELRVDNGAKIGKVIGDAVTRR